MGIIVQKEEKLGFIRIFVLIKCSRKELSEVLMIELNGKKKLLRLFSIFVSYVRLTKTSRTANSIMLWNLSWGIDFINFQISDNLGLSKILIFLKEIHQETSEKLNNKYQVVISKVLKIDKDIVKNSKKGSKYLAKHLNFH